MSAGDSTRGFPRYGKSSFEIFADFMEKDLGKKSHRRRRGWSELFENRWQWLTQSRRRSSNVVIGTGRPVGGIGEFALYLLGFGRQGKSPGANDLALRRPGLGSR
jgi:hypothetical protein